ncbi:MAG: ECF transporter S component [Firmicutes bacterium]|nr:ECF transporter S component [Bacillota bacterium]
MHYYLISVGIIILSIIIVFAGFEKRKPDARQLVTLAVMCALAIVSRIAFVLVPSFKPMMGIIIIIGMFFGPQSGFMAGAVSGFVSNFVFGQGPWTPFQMFAYGVGGAIAGLLAKAGVISKEKRLVTSIIGGLLIVVIVGPLLDTSTLFMVTTGGKASAGAVYLAGLPFNLVHGLCTTLTLFVLMRPIIEKLERIKTKYGF